MSDNDALLPNRPLPLTVRRMSEADFTAALHVLKQAVDATSSGIIISDPHLPDNPIIYHNSTFERLTGYQEAEITGRNCRFLQGPDTNPEAISCIRQAIRSRTDCQVTLLNYRKDGTPFWNELYMSPVREPRTGRLTHYIGVQNDVTARIKAEQERDALLEKQKRVANTLQEALLSLPAPLYFPGFDFHVLYQAAWEEAQVGGDFSDTFSLPSGETAFVVGDVTGKGLAAAAYTGQIKFALRVFLRDAPDPARAMARLNDFLFTAQRLDNVSQYALVSLCVAVVDKNGSAHFATAGAEPPLLLCRDGVQIVASEGPLLGVLEDAAYEVRPPTLLQAGDTVLLFTDGITEARPPRPGGEKRRRDSELFGMERLTEAAASCATLPVAELSQSIYDAALSYAGGRMHDDVCLMTVRFTP